MDFSLTEDQKMLRTTIRDFADKELAPIAAEIDEACRFPDESVAKAAAIGLTGVGYPEEYGGSGGGAVEQAIALEEVARVCAATCVILATSNELAAYPIYTHGTEEQKQKYLAPILKGQTVGAFGLTEPGAGSDVAAMTTSATRDGAGYTLSGNKIFITNGEEAAAVIVFATVDRSAGHRGVTAFIVEKGTPGFSVGRHEDKLGIRASSTVELIFENCTIPESNRLGEEGQGFRIALESLDASRIGIAAQAVGIAQGAFERSLAYAKERQQFGQPLAGFQAIQWILADMATQIDAARLLMLRAACLKDSGQSYVKEASMAKLFASETAMSVTTKAIQVHGGYGYTKAYPVERYFRDAKITEIYEGTSEIQRMTIARQLLRDV